LEIKNSSVTVNTPRAERNIRDAKTKGINTARWMQRLPPKGIPEKEGRNP
jgi:hypothetical protein